MTAWKDPLTGITYQSNGLWTVECLKHLARIVASYLKQGDARRPSSSISSAKRAFRLANILAQFWSFDYYRLLFPLRFGPAYSNRQPNNGASIYWEDPFLKVQQGHVVNLDDVLSSHKIPKNAFRSRSLERGKLPPILPLTTVQQSDTCSHLLAERLLLASFVVSSVVRYGGDTKHECFPVLLKDEVVSAVRLGVLASPFLASRVTENEGAKYIIESLKEIPLAFETASFLAREDLETVETSSLPGLLSPVIPAIRRWLSGAHTIELPPEVESMKIRLVAAAPQRIQRYIFESPGLWEIRGASSLLDEIIEDIRDMIAEEDGHEAIVRSAASTIEFLTISPGPCLRPKYTWDEVIKQKFYENAGDVWVAVGEEQASLKDVLDNWKTVSDAAWNSLQLDRSKSDVPAGIVLPFEQRCASCKSRAASFLDERKIQTDTLEWVCSTCAQKIVHGKKARGKAREILLTLGDECQQFLGYDGMAHTASSVNDLVALNTKHKLTGTVFGDGDNFGGISQRLQALPGAIHWSRRIDEVTQASAAVAMAISIANDQARGVLYEYLPFEVVTLGGDDLSFVTAGTIALSFTQCLMKLIDSEFRVVPMEGVYKGQELAPVTFSFGVVACDSKSPIRIVADWAERNAMKHAKRHWRRDAGVKQASTVSFVVADSIDELPSDWDDFERRQTRSSGIIEYREFVDELAERELIVKSVIMPLTSTQLQFILDVADSLRQFRGNVQGLAMAFQNSTPHAASLHYLYQKGRVQGTDREAVFRLIESRQENQHDNWKTVFPGKIFPWNAPDYGEIHEPFTQLLQIMKVTHVVKGGGGG